MVYLFAIVQSAIIYKDGKILMGLRSDKEDVFPNLWGIPGGKVDTTDETLEDALRREVREEAAIEIENIQFIQSNIHADKEKVYITYTADWHFGEPTPDEIEIIEYRFFDNQEIQELDTQRLVTPFTAGMIQRLALSR